MRQFSALLACALLLATPLLWAQEEEEPKPEAPASESAAPEAPAAAPARSVRPTFRPGARPAAPAPASSGAAEQSSGQAGGDESGQARSIEGRGLGDDGSEAAPKPAFRPFGEAPKSGGGVPANCPKGAAVQDIGGQGSNHRLFQPSGQITAFALPDLPKDYPWSSGKLGIGETPNTAGGSLLEIEIGKCPGVIVGSAPAPSGTMKNTCYIRTYTQNWNTLLWIAREPKGITYAQLMERGYCVAPEIAGPWFINVRYTYRNLTQAQIEDLHRPVDKRRFQDQDLLGCQFAGNCGYVFQWQGGGI
jgi:hypothetical protein